MKPQQQDWFPFFDFWYLVHCCPHHRGLTNHPNKKERFFTCTQGAVKLTAFFNRFEETVMPKKARNDRWSLSDIKFAQITLDEGQKGEFYEWAKGVDKRLFGLLTGMAGDGWKCSFGEDATNACYIASHTQQDEDDTNYHVCVSSRAETIEEALSLQIYKITVLFPSQTLPTERKANNWG
jgi:hypothetical protein